MSKLEIKYEIFDITKLVKSVDIIVDQYQIIKTLKKANKKASYIIGNTKGELFFLKVKLRDFSTDSEIIVYKKMKNLDGDGINKILSIYQTQKLLLVISEFIDGTCFDDALTMTSLQRELFDDNLQNIFNKLVETVQQLQSIDIIHCDIKPSNLIFKINGSDMLPVLIDYDLSKNFTSQQNLCNVPKFYGTLNFCSPEAKSGIINRKTDVWNLGLLFYLFIFNIHFDESEEIDINYELIASYVGKHKKIVDLLKDMLISDCVHRISIDDLARKQIFL